MLLLLLLRPLRAEPSRLRRLHRLRSDGCVHGGSEQCSVLSDSVTRGLRRLLLLLLSSALGSHCHCLCTRACVLCVLQPVASCFLMSLGRRAPTTARECAWPCRSTRTQRVSTQRHSSGKASSAEEPRGTAERSVTLWHCLRAHSVARLLAALRPAPLPLCVCVFLSLFFSFFFCSLFIRSVLPLLFQRGLLFPRGPDESRSVHVAVF